MRAVRINNFVFNSPKPSVNLSFKEQSAPTDQRHCNLQQEKRFLQRITQVPGGSPRHWKTPNPLTMKKLGLLPSAGRGQLFFTAKS